MKASGVNGKEGGDTAGSMSLDGPVDKPQPGCNGRFLNLCTAVKDSRSAVQIRRGWALTHSTPAPVWSARWPPCVLDKGGLARYAGIDK